MGLYVAFCDDCDENEGGYYCEVYLDNFLDHQIDYFCIHPGEFQTFEEAEKVAEKYIKDNFDAYLSAMSGNQAIVYSKKTFPIDRRFDKYPDGEVIAKADELKLEKITPQEVYDRLARGLFDPDIQDIVLVQWKKQLN